MTRRPLASNADTSPPCKACRGAKAPGMYLCWTCWYSVPAASRRALNRRDTRATARLRALYDHIDSGRPLADLEITP
ncbi:hypothetical protein [Streptomyces microflavus]|uniref:hypothetical protein n=1 Tax=Streptomyces microflavus TaxID=1919 RepID=UPI00382D1B64